MYPELGRAEFRTSEFLRDKIGQFGSLPISMVGETGFCADLISDQEKPWVALRADMDALPITDLKKVAYRSRTDGICHACGHDFHSTVVLGVVAVLAGMKDDLPVNIRFIFQHAEEPTPGGAIDFVRAGKLDNISAVFGLHADPTLPVKSAGIMPGWISAQSIHFKLAIQGPGGHSSRPQESPDPVHAGTTVMNALYGSLPRLNKPESPFVFTVGAIRAGEGYNSIAADFFAEGTLRVTDTRQGDALLQHIQSTLEDHCRRYGLSCQAEWVKGAPPVENDPVLTARVKSLLAEIMDDSRLLEHPRSMGGEDFSQFLVKCPGVFVRIGVGKGEKVHTGLFDIDESAIGFAVEIFGWILLHWEV